MENILLIRLKSIGDVVLTLPAVQAVRESFPTARITFLTSQENSELLRGGFAGVNETIILDPAKNPAAAIRLKPSGRFSVWFTTIARR